MRLIKKKTIHFFSLSISLCFLSLVIIAGISFAEPGIKITQPPNGSVVNPGQEITVTIEAVEGFVVEEGIANIAGSEHNERVTSLPLSFTDKIPLKAIGEVDVSVFGRDASGNLAMDDITLKVEQTATLQALEGLPEELSFETDWDGNIKDFYYPYMGGVYGMYSDGIKRDITHAGTTYISSDPSVISIDSEGKFQVHKVGDATITVSNSGVSKTIPVVFEKPHGIRPSETVPPTTQIDIQPLANQAGWHNQDITINITAQDNEGGSGFKELRYIWFDSPEYEFVPHNEVALTVSKEGENGLVYYAVDNELNKESTHRIKFKLDKTPPQIKISASPDILWPPNHKMVNVTVNGSATDTLSNIASTTFKVTDEYGKVEPKISKFGDTIQLEAWRKGDDLDGRIYTISVTATDYAGNKATTTATVTVPHDMVEKEKK